MASLPLSVRSQCCIPQPSGLVSWYAGENNANDQLGNNPGSLTNVTFTTGEVGDGFNFNGTSSCVGVPASASLNVGMGAGFTFETWIKPASVSALAGLGGWAGGSGAQILLDPMGSGTAEIFANLYDTSGSPHQIISAAVVGVGTFQHVAVSYDKASGVAKIYYNGQISATQNLGSFIPQTSTSLLLGRSDLFSTSYYFSGVMDEVSIYNRALADSEILAIYNAGSLGKCGATLPTPEPPVITAQPANQLVEIGGSATFAVTATGCFLDYQWIFNQTNISNATNATLTLTNVQSAMFGTYAVIVSNSVSAVTSSNALLSLGQGCVAPPSGLVSWWKGEGNTLDESGGNNGTLEGNSTYGPGEVGQALVFDGNNGGGMNVGASPNLQLQNFTIEAWVKRGSASVAGNDGFGGAVLFGYGAGGYAFSLDADGTLTLDNLGVSDVQSSAAKISDLNFHHLAVTKSGSNVVFYLDGVASPMVTYNTTFTFNSTASVGASGAQTLVFLGTIDELAVYNRALTTAEIQSIYAAASEGKCENSPPVIFTPPTNQTTIEGGSATFAVNASGSPIFAYQWYFGGTNLSGATNSLLPLTNVPFSAAGNYTVVVSNSFGMVTSAVATLTVNPPPPCTPPPSGLVSWWKGDGNTVDESGANNGTLDGNSTYAPGEVGQALVFDGNPGGGMNVGACPNLQLQNFTIEAWVQRGSISKAGNDGGGGGILFGYNTGGYSFSLNSDGTLVLDNLGVSDVQSAAAKISDLNFHHLAVTKSGSNVVFYLDGVASPVVIYNTTFTFNNSTASVGSSGGQTLCFLGTIDELAIYNRALTSAEIQSIYTAGAAGKCTGSGVPAIAVQPQSQTVLEGSNAIFSVSALGGFPLSYQWLKNGTNITNATLAFLTITNVQMSNAANYSVKITNPYGSVLSSNAALTVDLVEILAGSQLLTNAQYGFSGTVTITLKNLAGGDIFYTLDGSTPSFGSAQYTAPFVVAQNSIIQALGYSPDFSQSAVSGPVAITILPMYTLTATTAGGGKITLAPNTTNYIAYTNVTVTATASNGWTFLQWQGDLGGTNPVASVFMSRNKSVQAVFGTTVGATGAGGGSVILNPAGGVYPYGTTLQAEAVPQAGNEFAIWGNAASGNANPLSFTVNNANPTISALFASLGSGQAALAVVALGHGHVTISPQANTYPTGQSIILTAVPDSGKNFLGWSGGAGGEQNPLTVNLSQSETIYANFSTNNSLTLQLGPGVGTSEGVELNLNGELGVHYRVDGSTNLLTWVTLLNVTNDVGALHYIDSAATNFNYRFYRAVILP